MRQQLGEPGNRMGGYAGEDVLEPDEGIDADALTGSHETPQHSSGLASFITSQEQPIVATHGYTADGPLGGVVVDFEIAGLALTGERGPVLQGVAHRPPRRALR